MLILTENQISTIQVTERVASGFSLLGCSCVFFTFLLSSRFRKPINRLIFFASWGNLLANVAMILAHAGINAGALSPLCQFQAFLIQFCLPADAMWNLMMAINVYLTVFKNYGSHDLKALELRYIIICYGGPFIVAFVSCFCSTEARGRIYGPAILWCWITPQWDSLRIAFCYGPAWICIITSFTIYVVAGRNIFRRRKQLRAFQCYTTAQEEATLEIPFTGFKTTAVHISSAPAVRDDDGSSEGGEKHGSKPKVVAAPKTYEPYSVTIERGSADPILQQRPPLPGTRASKIRQNNAAMAANTAAWGYTKCALLFFLSLLITWVPSSINRVYSLARPDEFYWPFTYAAGLVLPLMGFWNSVIYFTTSWPAVKSLFADTGPHWVPSWPVRKSLFRRYPTVSTGRNRNF